MEWSVLHRRSWFNIGLFLLGIWLFPCISLISQEDITVPELYDHIERLTDPKLKGRPPGGKLNKKLIRYIRRDLKKAGVESFKGGYFQPFKAQIRVEQGQSPGPEIKTWNVVGYIPGSHPQLSQEFIVLGAHYDHLGMGGPSSRSETQTGLHYGADDNASGTSALLEIAEKLAANRSKLDRSIILVAFGAEEQGLLGSRYFIQN